MEKIKILNYGDSQGEVFDYIFYNNDEYIKYKDDDRIGWRSGWSTRGLKKHLEKFINPLNDFSEKDYVFIFLTFGSVDIEWNLSYKRNILNENPNVDLLIQEMIDSYIFIINKILESKLKTQIIICFPFMPMPLSEDYMDIFSKKTNTVNYKVISHNERCKLWDNFCDKLSKIIFNHYKNIKIIDIRNDFKENGYDKYSCLKEDHHPLLCVTQHLIIKKIKLIEFKFNNKILKLKPNEWKYNYMYPHIRRPL